MQHPLPKGTCKNHQFLARLSEGLSKKFCVQDLFKQILQEKSLHNEVWEPWGYPKIQV